MPISLLSTCTQCTELEGFYPILRYFDLTPCFLYLCLFPLFSGLGAVLGGRRLFVLRKASYSTYSNDGYFITRFFLIGFQVVLLLSLAIHSSSDLVKYSLRAEALVIVLVIAPLTFQDDRKLDTTCAELLCFWLVNTLLLMCQLMSASIRYTYEHNVSSAFVATSALALFLSLFITLFQAIPKRIQTEGNPLDSANIFALVSFGWMSLLMKLGYKKYLNLEDLPPLPKGLENKTVAESLTQNYTTALNRAKARKTRPSLCLVILRSFGFNLSLAAVFKVFQDILSFTQPQLLKLLIKFVNDYNSGGPEQPPVIKGFNIAFLMFLLSVFQTMFLNQYFFSTYTTGIQIKSALIGAIYDKSLVLSPESRQVKSTGDIVNLMSIDTQRLQDLTEFGQIIWSAPFQVIICLFSLYQLLQNLMWFGLGVMLLMVLANLLLVRFQKTLQKRQMNYKDLRIKVVSEILSKIKLLKLYCWEDAYKARLLHWRNDKELKNLSQILVFKSINMTMWNIIPFMVSCLTFYGYIKLYNKPLTTDVVFPALALFNLLGFPLNVLPNIITFMIDCNISLTRLNDFLVLDELEADAVTHEPRATQKGEEAIKFENCSFSWNKFNSEYSDADQDAGNINNYLALRDINFTAKKGELSCIIGKVGSGKSSFIKAMLGDLYKYKGKLVMKGKIAYVSQVAWIMNGTIKDNILFGHRFDKKLYDKVIFACDLLSDFKNFADGDQTQVGEKGISLSGGQKARLSLARAIYSGADLYLLDDPLAAVDEHVGKHLIDHVFGPSGMLLLKCKVLVTNLVHFLDIADNITLLENGAIKEVASNESLAALSEEEKLKSSIAQLISQFGKREKKEEDQEKAAEEAKPMTISDSVATESSNEVEQFDGRELAGKVVDDAASIDDRGSVITGTSLRRASSVSLSEAVVTYDTERDTEERKEKMQRGNVKWSVYLAYAKACSAQYVLVYLVFVGMTMVLNLGANYWLKHWSEVNTDKGYNPNVGYYLSTYALLGVAGSVALMFQGIIIYNVCLIRGSKNLHDLLTRSILRAPMLFFETTPIGRILNRFLSDINKVDEILPRIFNLFFMQFVKVGITVLVIAMLTWQFVVVMVPLSMLYVYYQQFYMQTLRELKRLELVTRSPIFAHFQETLNGITTIRGYGQEQRFMRLNEIKVDNNLGAYHPTVNCNRWLSTRLEFLGSLIILSSAALPMLGLKTGHTSAGLVGLSVSYALQVTGALNWTVRMTVEVETNIVSVERIQEYASLASEAPAVIPENRPPKGWPTEGAILFEKYLTRYRPELDLVLRGISVDIKPKEKIGIVGRTGAGKLSLTMALYRIIEPAEGDILIDGVPILKMGLADLRTKLLIIPQDAQVFEGTIRDNLDPTNIYKDEDIVKAIRLSHLEPHILKMIDEQNASGKEASINSILDVRVTENGDNLSVGQKQLMCLARALLIPAKILVLDEATAAVDVETDTIVQETIRSEFKNRTILTIAHRINTIVDSDRILVLDHGEVAEFDTPQKLLADKSSIFYSLAQRGGLV